MPSCPSSSPRCGSVDRLPNNLPLQLTSFLGRDHALASVAALLQSHRLLTLAGACDSGKTRLALQVAATTLDRFTDGTWFVDLAAVVDPDLVPRMVADVLGVHEMPLETPMDAVAR